MEVVHVFYEKVSNGIDINLVSHVNTYYHVPLTERVVKIGSLF